MGVRRVRRQLRQLDMATSRTENGHVKTKERFRRDHRMLELIKKGTFPYTPSIMSWLSLQLDKPSRLITEQEVAALTKGG